jgi:hypothetical protein
MNEDVAIRTRFVKEMTKLNLWYVRQLLAREEITTKDVPLALTRRVNIYRMTTFWDGTHDPAFGYNDPSWHRLAERLAKLVCETPADDTSALEEKGLALLWPLLKQRIPLDVRPVPPQPFGCWRYAPAWCCISDQAGRWRKFFNVTYIAQRLRLVPYLDAELHFNNAMKPQSPFDHLPSLASSLQTLVADCRRQYAAVRRLWMYSWLNSVSTFRMLFPATWAQSGIRRPPSNYQSWWGQFVNKTGGFNDKIAAQFRASGGEFPYPSLLCHARIEEIEAHLVSFLTRGSHPRVGLSAD